MFRPKRSSLPRANTPMFRHGGESATRDLARYGTDHVQTFLAYARELDPSAWYTLGYQDKATEGN